VQEDWVLFNRVMNSTMSLRKILTITTLLFGVAYLILPMDIIPDSAGLVGLVDDLLVWLMVLWFLVAMLEGYRNSLIIQRQN